LPHLAVVRRRGVRRQRRGDAHHRRLRLRPVQDGDGGRPAHQDTGRSGPGGRGLRALADPGRGADPRVRHGGEPVLMRGVWPAVIGLAVLAVAGLGAAGAAGLVDTVVAEVGTSPIMLSDVTLARALGVLGLEPSDGPVSDAELGRYLDAQLVLREAAQL